MPAPIQASYNNKNTMITVIAPIKYASLGRELTNTKFPTQIKTGHHSCTLTFPVAQIVTHELDETFALTLKNNAIPGNVADLSGEANYAHEWDTHELRRIKETIHNAVENSIDAKIQITLAKLQLEELKMRHGNVLVKKDVKRADKLSALVKQLNTELSSQQAIITIETALPEYQAPRGRAASITNTAASKLCHHNIFRNTTTKGLLLELKALLETQTLKMPSCPNSALSSPITHANSETTFPDLELGPMSHKSPFASPIPSPPPSPRAL